MAASIAVWAADAEPARPRVSLSVGAGGARPGVGRRRGAVAAARAVGRRRSPISAVSCCWAAASFVAWSWALLGGQRARPARGRRSPAFCATAAPRSPAP